MPTYKFAELILLNLSCDAPECGEPFEKTLRALANRDSIPCPTCKADVDLKPYKGAIDDRVEFAAELDKAPRQ